MEPAPNTVQPWTLLVDPEAAQSAIQRISKLGLVRHICHPLDSRQKRLEGNPWARFDAAIEAETQDSVLDNTTVGETVDGIN